MSVSSTSSSLPTTPDYIQELVQARRKEVESSPYFKDITKKDMNETFNAWKAAGSGKSPTFYIIRRSETIPGSFALNTVMNPQQGLINLLIDIPTRGPFIGKILCCKHVFNDMEHFNAFQSVPKIIQYYKTKGAIEVLSQKKAERVIEDWVHQHRAQGYIMWISDQNENNVLHVSYCEPLGQAVTQKVTSKSNFQQNKRKLNEVDANVKNSIENSISDCPHIFEASTSESTCIRSIFFIFKKNFINCVNNSYYTKPMLINLNFHDRCFWQIAKKCSSVTTLVLSHGIFGHNWTSKFTDYPTHFWTAAEFCTNNTNPQDIAKSQISDYDINYASNWQLPVTKLELHHTVFNSCDSFYTMFSYFPLLEELYVNNIQIKNSVSNIRSPVVRVLEELFFGRKKPERLYKVTIHDNIAAPYQHSMAFQNRTAVRFNWKCIPEMRLSER